MSHFSHQVKKCRRDPPVENLVEGLCNPNFEQVGPWVKETFAKEELYIEMRTRDLAPKAKVLRCPGTTMHYRISEGVACSVGVAHQWGGGMFSGGGASVGGGMFSGGSTSVGAEHHWGWHVQWGGTSVGVAYISLGGWFWSLYTWLMGVGIHGGQAKARVSLLPKPLELQYYFAPFAKAAKYAIRPTVKHPGPRCILLTCGGCLPTFALHLNNQNSLNYPVPTIMIFSFCLFPKMALYTFVWSLGFYS